MICSEPVFLVTKNIIGELKNNSLLCRNNGMVAISSTSREFTEVCMEKECILNMSCVKKIHGIQENIFIKIESRNFCIVNN